MDYLPIILFYTMGILVWLIPMLIALRRLSKRILDETAKAIWVLVVVAIPVIGPLAYLVMSSVKQDQKK
jgi:hypothetical protein